MDSSSQPRHPLQALRIWHAAIESLRRSNIDGTLSAVSASQRGAVALDAVVAEYGSHPLRQDSELDRLLLSVDEDAEEPQQSSAASPEQVCMSPGIQHENRIVHCPAISNSIVIVQALETWSATFEAALDSVEADVRGMLAAQRREGQSGEATLQMRLQAVNEVQSQRPSRY